ncbi:fibroblast growth factor 8/17/18 precursor [Saccoglossus kowalevskii]|uniref:Fibroblast growth factor 8/17/18 precursor n=1 Tax=Saccoglossus kowalevskii TaxID=10224 RepID=D2XMS5_SACKO|nr:fibroblast growth factor 8/17/18 precursor [Saccoglossus kowalevskii]ADB22412.1 fibroblast growth factor 8/17/18 protein [Saccoglossus kowalevskii]
MSTMLPHRCYTLLLHVVLWCWQLQESIQLATSLDDQFEAYVDDPDHAIGNLPVIRKLQLYSRPFAHHVRIFGNRKVDAKGENGDIYARLIIETETFSKVTIRGEESKFYLCMNSKGKAVGRPKKSGGRSYSCIFKESISDNGYTEYESVRYEGWFLSFGRDGKTKSALRTSSLKKAVQFMKRELPEVERTSNDDKQYERYFRTNVSQGTDKKR